MLRADCVQSDLAIRLGGGLAAGADRVMRGLAKQRAEHIGNAGPSAGNE